MHRFFISKDKIINNNVIINGKDVNHIRNVLRLKCDDTIVVCDSNGNEYIVEIIDIQKEEVKGKIIKTKAIIREAPIDIVLYQGLPKSSKMDLIVQKATELGAIQIVPVITARTVVKIKDKAKENKKIARWNKIAGESAKQARRGMIPKITELLSFDTMITNLKDEDNIIVPYEDEQKTGIKDIVKQIEGNKINIIIGPEGGFEKEEIFKLKGIGSNIVSLGPRILRTETAGFAVISMLMYELGDMGVSQFG